MSASAAPAPSKAPKPSLAAALEAFKKDGSDANREAVIKAARGAKDPQSDEAERFEGRAEYAFKKAKDEPDFAAAAVEYRKAADAAPWKAENYFNWGVAEERAGNLAGAKRAFEWYLKADPAATDAKETRKRIAGLEMGIEQANSSAGPDLTALTGDWVQKDGLVWYSKTEVVDGTLRLRTVAYDEESGRRQTAAEGHWGHYRFKWDGSAFKGVYVEGSQGYACAGRESPASAVFSPDGRQMTVTMTKQYGHPAYDHVVNPRECIRDPKPEYTFTITRQ